MTRLFILSAMFAPAAWCQTPAIFPRGVVNAADYAVGTDTVGQIGMGVSAGSIVSIFGTNLAASAQTAGTIPLPIQLGGTSVTVSGIPAPLFFVSPGQINIQMPSAWRFATDGARSIVVSTASGASDAYALDLTDALGIFTHDSSGCGEGAVLNVSGSGATSPNSPSNSAAPGGYISIYGTGLGVVAPGPDDGSPAPLVPLSVATIGSGFMFDFVEYVPIQGAYWAGRAPGLIGVDQLNVQIPATAREGCAVPLQIFTDSISQPVTVSVHKGGGACVDPPSAGYGQISWEKTVITTAEGSASESETVTASLQASPGRQAPPAPAYTEGVDVGGESFSGPSCPIPGYRSLGAGTLAIQGPGFGPIQVPAVPLQQGQVSGLSVYQAALPGGAIQPGSFSATASGGADVGAFQSSVRIGSGIQVTTALAGRTSSPFQPFTVNWTGGDPDTWVTLRVGSHGGSLETFRMSQAHATDGTVALGLAGGPPASIGLFGTVEIVLEVTPDPSQTPSFSATGLSLGGENLWKYTYRFEGVTFQ